MNESTGNEQAWHEIQARVDELLRESLSGNLFYKMKHVSGDSGKPVEMSADNKTE